MIPNEGDLERYYRLVRARDQKLFSAIEAVLGTSSDETKSASFLAHEIRKVFGENPVIESPLPEPLLEDQFAEPPPPEMFADPAVPPPIPPPQPNVAKPFVAPTQTGVNIQSGHPTPMAPKKKG